MKKVLFLILAFAGLFLVSQNLNAQSSPRIGVFDIDIMVQAMPGYGYVDSLLGNYEQDSLRGDYDYAVKEYNRLDSTYKSDSAQRKSASVLDYIKNQRSQIATTIVYWQQIAQQKLAVKRQQLAQPLLEQIAKAYQKVLRENNYLVILKPDAVEMYGSTKVENIFEKVAKELNIRLPEQLRTTPQEAMPERPSGGAGTGNKGTGGARKKP